MSCVAQFKSAPEGDLGEAVEMTRFFLIVAIGIVSGIFAGQAQAETVWRFPYKGTPYAVDVTPASQAQMTHPRWGTRTHFAQSHVRHGHRRYVGNVRRHGSYAAAERPCGRAAHRNATRVVWHYPYKGTPYAVRVSL